jgi:vancomycin resistance protein VanJ
MQQVRTSRVFLSISVLNSLCLVFLCWLDERFAEQHWLITIIAYIPQHPFALLTVLLIVWAIVKRNARGVLLQVPSLVLLLVYFFGLNIPFGSNHTFQNGIGLRVMSYNLYGKTATSAVIQAANADVICVQESRDQKLLQSLQQALPKYFIAHEGEITTFSRFPIRTTRVQHLTRSWRTILETDIDVNGRLIRVVNVHFNTLNIQGGSYYQKHPESIATRVSTSIEDRQEAVKILLEIAGHTNMPLLVMGDFNTPTRGTLYNALKSQLEDAFATTGWGFGYSFRSDLPLLRLDYVWTNRFVRPTQTFTDNTLASDHRPLIAQILVNR